MAEAAGLVVGVAALVGTFKECVDLISYISAVGSLGRDFEILSIKLDVEKTLLLQWALRVRLLELDYDTRLTDPYTADAVSNTLACIRLQLNDGGKLKNRYGLQKNEAKDASEMTPNFLSGQAMHQIDNAFSKLSIRASLIQEAVTPLRAIRWAIHDKAKFQDLVAQLSELVAKLNRLVPKTLMSTPPVAWPDLGRITEARDLRLILDATSECEPDFASVAEKRLATVCQKNVLERLWFRFMGERKDNVAAPHPRTLRWALEPPVTGSKWDSLSHWLRTGAGIYWVSGKPGSGKSTLMKHMCDSQHTAALLNAWAGNGHCKLSSFFFWYRGRPELRSQEGLSRALLYNVILHDRSLICTLLPNMWREAYNATEGALALPSITEMQVAFETLASLQITHRYCSMVDGLDEYEGDYRVGIRSLELLASNANIKIIVSSRPISECFAAFSRNFKLYMHDLNRDDILTYVQSTVGNHSQMQDLLELSRGHADKLLKNVVDKASGVFLWVVLACRSLVGGLTKGDGLSDLQNRLDELPPELEEMFDHILCKIEARYHTQAAKLLRACFTLEHDNEVHECMPAEGLSILDNVDMDILQVPGFRKMSHHLREVIYTRFHARLRSRCWGLLEIQRVNNDNVVLFMHRTVYDFLATGKPWNHPTLQIPNPESDGYAVLETIHLWHSSEAFETHTGYDEASNQAAMRHFVHAILFASKIRNEYIMVSAVRTLEAFFACVKAISTTSPPLDPNSWLSHLALLVRSTSQSAFIVTIEAGLINFAKAYQASKAIDILDDDEKQALLYHVFALPAMPAPFTSEASAEEIGISGYGRVLYLDGQAPAISTDMAKLLFSLGCNPNRKYANGYSAWQYWLCCWNQHFGADLVVALDVFDLMELFVKSGANLDRTHCGADLGIKIQRAFGLHLEGKISVEQRQIRSLGIDLLKLIEERRALYPNPSIFSAGMINDSEDSSVGGVLSGKRRRSRSYGSDTDLPEFKRQKDNHEHEGHPEKQYHWP